MILVFIRHYFSLLLKVPSDFTSIRIFQFEALGIEGLFQFLMVASFSSAWKLSRVGAFMYWRGNFLVCKFWHVLFYVFQVMYNIQFYIWFCDVEKGGRLLLDWARICPQLYTFEPQNHEN